ncbi:MAG TPA: dihydrodipicolinate synthase family protein, partial [Bacillota bacterium]
MGKAPDFLRGIFAAVTTPFTEDGDLSLDNLERNLQMWLVSPLQGFLVLGSTGEFVHLSFDEKLQAVEAAVRAAEERPVLAGTGSHSTRETVELSAAAASLGAAAVLVITPFYHGRVLRDAAMYDHFVAVADAVDVPVVLYHNPRLTAVDLSVTLVSELAAHPNIVGIKDSSGDLARLAHLVDETPEGFAVLTGSGHLLHPALQAGASGAVLAVAGVAPWECCEIYSLWREGKHDDAAALQRRLNVVERVIRRYGIGGIKGLMRMIGYYGGPPR